MKNIFNILKALLSPKLREDKKNNFKKNEGYDALAMLERAGLGPSHDLPLFTGIPTTIYIIASTGRSGSTFLAQGLTSTKLAGNPAEFFNERHFDNLKQRWQGTPDEFMSQLFAYRTSPNGICGMKIHGHIIESTRNYWESYVNKFILIERKDKIGQGISLFKANLTNSWSSKKQPEKFLTFQDYDFIEVAKNIALLIDHSMKWPNYFASRQIKPINILYEDLEQNPQQIVVEIMQNAFGIIIDPAIVSFNNLKRQRDELSDYYKQRFFEDFATKQAILSDDIVKIVTKEMEIYNS